MDPFSIDQITFPSQNLGHFSDAKKWTFCVDLIKPMHQLNVQEIFTQRLVIVIRSCQSQQLADMGDARFWRIDTLADYGKLNALAKNRVILIKLFLIGMMCYVY
jgi:hypothetical protein